MVARSSTCCIVGGGPAGVMLALLLVRQGLQVTLLEAQPNFERDFRGDAIYPYTLEVLDQLGLGQALHRLPHTKSRSVRLITERGNLEVARFSQHPFPYVMLMPQSRLLEFLVGEARRFPNFRLELGARVESLLEEGGKVVGVSYRQGNHSRQIRADLTVGCDGRTSRVRKLAGLEASVSKHSLTDLLWLKLPRSGFEPRREQLDMYLGHGYFMIALEHAQCWQIGLGIPKHSFPQIRAEGLEALGQKIAHHLPWLANVQSLQSWSEVQLFSVRSHRLMRWHKPGLLLIGDAAHSMSPIGGVGINLALHDAVAAANRLTRPLQRGNLSAEHLAAVQREREGPAAVTQWWTGRLEAHLHRVMTSPQPGFHLTLLHRLMRLPYLVDVSTSLIGYGFRPPRIARETAVASD